MAIVSVMESLAASTYSATFLLCAVAGSFLTYLVFLGIYRLYLSPLAKFPGPKLAALTGWVETYHEIFNGNGGQFVFEYRKWHEKYGPVVRISPTEVHIQDSAFYETLFYSTRSLDKLHSLESRFGNPGATFATADHSLHRLRRSALNPFFSKRKVSEHAPQIQVMMNRVCDRLSKEYLGTGKVLTLNKMWGSISADSIVNYTFERRYDFIDEPDFDAPFTTALVDLLDPVHFIMQFPWLNSFLNALPDSVTEALLPRKATVNRFNEELMRQITSTLQNHETYDEEKKLKPSTLFRALLASNLPKEQLTATRLHHEAISIIAGGAESTMRCWTVACVHLLSNPPMLQRLREELMEAIPDPADMPSWDALAKLPYLTACIEEALRLAYGTGGRLTRVITDSPLPCNSYVIPTGVAVSMDNYDVSHDENIFPDSYSFKPERFLNNPRAPDGKQLSRYMVSFSKGSRACVGMQLAYAELYIGLATIIRRFEFELYDTDRSDVDMHMDRFVPRPVPSSKGARVLVTKEIP